MIKYGTVCETWGWADKELRARLPVTSVVSCCRVCTFFSRRFYYASVRFGFLDFGYPVDREETSKTNPKPALIRFSDGFGQSLVFEAAALWVAEPSDGC